MREFIEDTYGVEVIRWAEPADDGGELYEVVQNGRVIRADSLPLVLAAVQDIAVRPVRLAWTNIIAGTFVLPTQMCAA